MPEKINRDICLIKYRAFPLRAYDSNAGNDEIYYYPKVHSKYWIALETKSSKTLGKVLSTELTQLFKSLNIENLIFFGDYDRSWISKFTETRNDYKPLIEAVLYFKNLKIGNRFKGGIKVKIEELSEFISHFYVLTKCDASFCHYHFIDEEQTILGFIHYSGEVQIMTLNCSMNDGFKDKVSNTKFIDSFRDNTERLNKDL